MCAIFGDMKQVTQILMVTWPGQARVIIRKAEPGNIFTKWQIECKPELTVLEKEENIFYSCTHIQHSMFASYVKTQKHHGDDFRGAFMRWDVRGSYNCSRCRGGRSAKAKQGRRREG